MIKYVCETEAEIYLTHPESEPWSVPHRHTGSVFHIKETLTETDEEAVFMLLVMYRTKISKDFFTSSETLTNMQPRLF